jgi:hypothetical protein
MSLNSSLTLMRAARDWRPLVGGLVAVAALALTLGRSQLGFVKFVAFYGPPLIAVSILGGLVEYSQRASVWLLLAQRPGSMVRTTWSLLGAGLGAYAAAVVVAAGAGLLGAMLNPAVTGAEWWGLLVTTVAWTAVVGSAVAVTSTMARAGTAAVSVMWLVSPVLLAFVKSAAGFSDGVGQAIGFLLPPFDAVFELPKLLRGEIAGEAPRYVAQLVTFPLLCAALLGWRLRLLSRPERPRVD